MTIREFYQTVLNTCGTTISPWGEDEEQIVDICHKQIAALDARNEKRKSTPTKEQKEAAARKEAVLKFLKAQTEPVTRDTIAGVLDITPAQATAACKALGELVAKSEVKVDKARKVAYSIA